MTRVCNKPVAALLMLVWSAALLLSGCGFHLRGPADLPFSSLYVQAPPSSQFATQLKRVVAASSATAVVDDAKAAQATLQLVVEQREKEILSLSGTGRVREFQLRYRIRYRVVDNAQRELVPTSEILLRRDFSFNDQEALSKESEEALLYRDMQTDAVQQLLRRLQVVKKTA
ncbi:MAG TPA: LPS assembly lipoprotein LptE [Burkholderiales bacterium]|nr:LPS assembly lipoprotein LptE [Burkholderiales bacterium]